MEYHRISFIHDDTEYSFIKAMNDTAKKIGLENTSFENPIGKDNENN